MVRQRPNCDSKVYYSRGSVSSCLLKYLSMSQAFVSVKNLAAYCLDYARLVSPVLAKSSAKTDVLSKDILDCAPLFTQPVSEDKAVETVSLPIHLQLTAEVVETAEQAEL